MGSGVADLTGRNAGIARGLGLPDEYFETQQGGLTTSDSSYWVTRVIHYPPLQEVSPLISND